METLDELKAIIAGKPDGAEFVSLCGSSFAKFKGGKFLQFIDGGYLEIKNCNIYSRSLSDIERIIELMEVVEDAAALGFLTPSFDSGVSHKQLCKKYEAMKL